MPSQRVQRQIDALLDDVESAARALEWDRVRELCDGVLRLDPENEDARAFLDAARRDSGVASENVAPPSAPAAPAPTTPTTFASGRYEVRRFLGEGGKKRVFLAHDSLLDRDVAFALVRTEGLDATGRERVRREAQAMGRLGNHANLVSVLDLGQERIDGSEQPYIVMEYMGGGSVADGSRPSAGCRSGQPRPAFPTARPR